VRERILARIAAKYLAGEEFNGQPAVSLIDDAGTEADLIRELRALIEDGLVSLNWGDRHPNPHIKASPPLEAEIQLGKMADN
jgi:hypothetical protein